jgi:hydroxyacylglutathione hydrolase
MTLEIHQFLCRTNNYGVIIRDAAKDVTAAIDTPDERAIRAELDRLGLQLTHIFTTHHHHDHVEGHAALRRDMACIVVGAEKDRDRIPGIDVTVQQGDIFAFGRFEVHVLETPGHTSGHVSYYLPNVEPASLLDFGDGAGAAFVGDTLFSVGCGRIGESTAGTMWQSLQKIAALPPRTLIYCGHEYTQNNIAFALTVEPGNADLLARKLEVEEGLARGKPSLPVRLESELKTNPFLRPHSPEIRAHLGMPDAPDAEVFAELRRRKDRF